MIVQAVLYLPAAGDAAATLLPVAGRPVAFRVVATAVRAGVRRVGVPGRFHGTAVADAIARSPSARRAVVWLSPGDAPWNGPVLLVPATVLVPAATVASMLAEVAPAVLEGSEARLAVLEAEALQEPWPALAAGQPSGAPLARLTGLARRRPPEAGAWQIRVDSPAAAREAEARLYDSLGNPAVDTALDRVLHRPVSRRLSRACVAIGLTPNQLSLASLAVGLVAAWLVSRATPAATLGGVLLYFVAVVLDHVDGEVARLTLAESRLGHWLDLLADTAVHAVLVVAMGWSAARAGHDQAVPLGLLAAFGVVASALAAALLPIGRSPAATGAFLARVVEALGNRNGYYGMLLAFALLLPVAPAALGVLGILVAAGTNAYWIARLAAARPWRAAETAPRPGRGTAA